MNKFLITQSLLSSWGWSFKLDNGFESFLKTLNREPIQKTQPMLDGIQFENMIAAYAEGAPLDESHKWAQGIKGVGDIVKNAALQVRLSKNVVIDNVEFVLYGILDGLECGTIYDIKFSKTYKHGKYLDSPQHPMYFEICPGANRFVYVISNGKDVFQEEYRKDNTEPIESEIRQFMKYLDEHNLTDIYCEKWRSKY